MIGLRVAGLTKSYGASPVLADVSFDVPGGGITALTGPNGVGKSTLLDCVAGSAPFDEGTVEVFGRLSRPSSAEHWRAVHGVLDDFTWLPGLSVLDHLMLLSPEPSPDAVRSALRAFGVAGAEHRRPAALSSGQRQRVALATARVRPWRVLLLDEPEAHLDTDGVKTLARELRSLLTPDRCVLLSTHDSMLVDALGCVRVELTRAVAG